MSLIVSPIGAPIQRRSYDGIVGAGPYYHDGISYDARIWPERGGRCIVKAPGAKPSVGALTDFFTFASGNQAKFRGASGLLVPSLTNTPRVEYDAGGNVLGPLFEGSRANLVLQSEDFSTSWTRLQILAFGSGSVVNSIAGPDGNATADTITEDATAAAQHYIQAANVAGLTAVQDYCASCFFKTKERFRGRIVFIDSSTGDGAGAFFNLSTGTITSTATFGAGTLTGSGIEAFANGWYRAWVSGKMNNARTIGTMLLNLADAGGNLTYNGDGASGMYFVGAQLEPGTFPSSYVPTTTVAVTRPAETSPRALGSEFSATAGTIIVEFDTKNTDASAFATACALDDGSTNNRHVIARNNSGNKSHFTITGGVSQANIQGGNAGATMQKSGYAFAAADFSACIAGVILGGVGVGSLPTVTTLRLGNPSYGADQLFGHIRRFDYWPERKSNPALQVLTQ